MDDRGRHRSIKTRSKWVSFYGSFQMVFTITVNTTGKWIQINSMKHIQVRRRAGVLNIEDEFQTVFFRL